MPFKLHAIEERIWTQRAQSRRFYINSKNSIATFRLMYTEPLSGTWYQTKVCISNAYIILYFLCTGVGRASSVGIATRCRQDGPGIQFPWRRDFSHTSRPALGPTQPLIEKVPGLFPGRKQPGRGLNHPPTFSADVKGKVELYLYHPLGFDKLF